MRIDRTLPFLAALVLAACGEGDPAPAAPNAQVVGTPGTRLLGRWQVPEATLPPTTIELARGAAGTTARVALSGIAYDGRATGDDTSVVIHDAERARIRGVLASDGARLRIEFLRADGTAELTQLLARVR